MWLIGGLRYADVPERERHRAEAAVDRAAEVRSEPERTDVEQVHFASKVRMLSEMKRGDWAITCVRDGAGADVWPPQQLLSVESYSRGGGKRRWVMQFETPKSRVSIRLRRLQHMLRHSATAVNWSGHRTKAIHDAEIADTFLRFWTRGGRPSAQTGRSAG